MLVRFGCVFHFESIPGDFGIPIGFMKAISLRVVEFLKNIQKFAEILFYPISKQPFAK
jgi:hypothetical protein